MCQTEGQKPIMASARPLPQIRIISLSPNMKTLHVYAILLNNPIQQNIVSKTWSYQRDYDIVIWKDESEYKAETDNVKERRIPASCTTA